MSYFLFGTRDYSDGGDFGMDGYRGKFDSPASAYEFAKSHGYEAAHLAHLDDSGELIRDGEFIEIINEIDEDRREIITGWGTPEFYGSLMMQAPPQPAVITIEVERWKERYIPPAPVAPYEQPKTDETTGFMGGTIMMSQMWPQGRWERIDE
jgi:hypothetical protein